MSSYIFIIISVVIVLCWLVGWAFIRILNRLERNYKKALEINQKQLDQQMSRINILVRALPNLKSVLSSLQIRDTWKALCLDEARALLWADTASYWRFVQKDEEFELDIARGANSQQKSPLLRMRLDEKNLGKAALQRVPILLASDNTESGTGNEIFVPLVVSGNLWGLFQFERSGSHLFNQRDLDLVSMFISQLSLALENRDMVLNREKFYLELVQTLAETLDSRDASSEGQSRRARELSRAVAREMEMPEEFIYYLEFAALLHDVGKIAIDDRVLKKPGKLTAEEFALVKKHPELGYQILAPVSMLAPVVPMVLYHQEWFNGKGYPEGLKGEEIPLGARIVSVLDAWGAMTTSHPWRKAMSKQDALNQLKKGAGTQFDPQVVDAFISVFSKQGVLVEK